MRKGDDDIIKTYLVFGKSLEIKNESPNLINYYYYLRDEFIYQMLFFFFFFFFSKVSSNGEYI